VVIFLETAELRAKNRLDIPLAFWKENVDRILASNDRAILTGTGSVSNARMEKKARKVYEEFDAKRKSYEAQQADLQDMEELEKKIKKNKK
jgi:hypothetical protein